MVFNFSGRSQENVKLTVWKEEIRKVDNFKYLGSTIPSNAGVEQYILNRT